MTTLDFTKCTTPEDVNTIMQEAADELALAKRNLKRIARRNAGLTGSRA